jgi:hypothetical protein
MGGFKIRGVQSQHSRIDKNNTLAVIFGQGPLSNASLAAFTACFQRCKTYVINFVDL